MKRVLIIFFNFDRQCEILNCNFNEPSLCAGYESRYCAVTIVQNYCPRLCGRCPTTPSVPTTAKACPLPLSCINGVFNNQTCKCDCYTGTDKGKNIR